MKKLLETNWVEVKIKMNPAELESCSAGFFELGCKGINELESEVVLYFDAIDWTDQLPDKIKTHVQTILGANSNLWLIVNNFPAENWEEKWKENFRAFRLGTNIVIRPEWESYQPQEADQVLVINPKMAFGTGHHETTCLILEQLELMNLEGTTLLDAGTGSAILGIYAVKRGAKKVVAFDNDPVAIENAHENAGLNNVADRMDIRCCELDAVIPQAYDIISANINRNVLLSLSEVFMRYVHPGTKLILSGLLETDIKDVRPVYEKSGWRFIQQSRQSEWVCMVLQAPESILAQ